MDLRDATQPLVERIALRDVHGMLLGSNIVDIADIMLLSDRINWLGGHS